MSKSHTLLKFLRKAHLYIGLFTAPALLFFAVTGALQTFSLHETTQGSSYKPPAWIASLAQLHKKQNTDLPPRRQRPAPPPGAGADPSKTDYSRPDKPAAPSPPDRAKTPGGADLPMTPPKSHLPMKIFFLVAGLGLCLSTLTGIYMAYRYNQSKLLVTGMLLAGIVIPLLLLPF